VASAKVVKANDPTKANTIASDMFFLNVSMVFSISCLILRHSITIWQKKHINMVFIENYQNLSRLRISSELTLTAYRFKVQEALSL